MEVVIGVSNKHVHLTKEDFKYLFGLEDMEIRSDLKQPGQFATHHVLNLRNGDKVLENVRVLGPFRSYTQVELSGTDLRMLGMDAPVRDSGDLEGASRITLEKDGRRIEKAAAIIATRHIHITPKELNEFGLKEGLVDVYVDTEKPVIFKNVNLKVSENSYYEMHIDTDDANGARIKNGMIGKIIINK